MSDARIDRKDLDRADQAREADRPKPPKKEERSTFDDLLEQSRLQNQQSFSSRFQSQKATQHGVQETENREEKRRQDRQGKEKEEKEEKRGTRDEGRSEGSVVSHKVVGKAGTGERQSQSGGGGERGSGGSSEKKSQTKSLDLKKQARVKLESGFQAEKFQQALAKQSLGQAGKTALDPAVVRALVRYVRVGVGKLGEKELQMDLHEAVFRGLQLRLSAKDGKVRVHFLTRDAATKALFESNLPQMTDALEKKGILVESIKVS